MLTAAVQMEHNQNTNATIHHQRAIESNLMTILDFFYQSLKKTGRCREALAVGDGRL